MTLPASGSISLAQVRAEIGGSGSVVIPSTEVRTLTGVSSGPITLPNDFWGKSWAPTVVASPSSVNGSGPADGGTVTTGATTATPTGGSGSFTYSWAFTSGGTSIAIDSVTTATTTFSSISFGPVIRTGTAVCTVTDTVSGAAVQSNGVSVTIEIG